MELRWLEQPSQMRRARNVLSLSPLQRIVRFPFLVLHFASMFVLFPFLALTFWSPMMGNSQKVQQKASKTAYSVTRLRHMLFCMGLCDDYIAGLFLSPLHRAVDNFIAIRPRLDGYFPGLPFIPFGAFTARTEVGDELIRRFVKDGGRQIICLGAGLDTRAYRIDCVTSGKVEPPVKYFEVDIASTQEMKLRSLRDNNIDNSHVTYVPVDFTVETFSECLVKKSWKLTERSLFLWEGVTYYLPEKAVHDTLRAFAKCPKGSLICFDAMNDFFSEEGKKHTSKFPGVNWMISQLQKIGEPLLWGISEPTSDGIARFLAPFGLDLVEHLAPEDIDDFFTRKENGKLAGGKAMWIHIIIAKVR